MSIDIPPLIIFSFDENNTRMIKTIRQDDVIHKTTLNRLARS
ncbi:hypothetical protein ECL_02205 [Enterobacter cloacae subsp. cloacae ATCC 13047]|uniref:Uncharacterized protein n=1 Tax=Enterobacter cloacae subsp. cloacae (strain ATCC 13047 / DSM 30054 / NBRC 13535 / NCTC 10005 / WDCM 00083 / NCDC 279-56) TaxID=716541 RepID=A0A0H3CMF2_ENTCC|nr:hypothetical protein ECL_02205 [Enterobacter cloacae subsp. cloacae ATCC 13047]